MGKLHNLASVVVTFRFAMLHAWASSCAQKYLHLIVHLDLGLVDMYKNIV